MDPVITAAAARTSPSRRTRTTRSRAGQRPDWTRVHAFPAWCEKAPRWWAGLADAVGSRRNYLRTAWTDVQAEIAKLAA